MQNFLFENFKNQSEITCMIENILRYVKKKIKSQLTDELIYA